MPRILTFYPHKPSLASKTAAIDAAARRVSAMPADQLTAWCRNRQSFTNTAWQGIFTGMRDEARGVPGNLIQGDLTV